jgi:hypothetical protein
MLLTPCMLKARSSIGRGDHCQRAATVAARRGKQVPCARPPPAPPPGKQAFPTATTRRSPCTLASPCAVGRVSNTAGVGRENKRAITPGALNDIHIRTSHVNAPQAHTSWLLMRTQRFPVSAARYSTMLVFPLEVGPWESRGPQEVGGGGGRRGVLQMNPCMRRRVETISAGQPARSHTSHLQQNGKASRHRCSGKVSYVAPHGVDQHKPVRRGGSGKGHSREPPRRAIRAEAALLMHHGSVRAQPPTRRNPHAKERTSA